MEPLYNVLVVGGSGLVGNKLIEILIEKEFPFSSIKYTKSSKEGSNLFVNGVEVELIALNEKSFDDIDFCFFCSTSEVSSIYGKLAKEKCKYVIDNSSYFRMDKDVPLIIPEINFSSINSSLIANPNCSTIQSLLVIDAIRKQYSLKKIIYSTYQSCSGGGKEELKELNKSFSKISNIYSELLCDTCISQIGIIDDSGFSLEEIKMINETKKILGDYQLEVHASCIRVPVSYCHGVFIYFEVEENVNIENIIHLLRNNKRLSYIEDNQILYFQKAYQQDNVLVGRVKKDLNNPRAFSLFCVADNLRVGAAYNAYNIASYLIRRENEKNTRRST